MFFLVVNLASSFSPTNHPNPLQCADRYSLSQTIAHSSLQSLSLMVFAFVAASLCWPPPQSLLFGWLVNLSKNTHIDYHAASMLLLCSLSFFSFFLFLVCLLLAWCLVFGWSENVGKQRKYIYIYIFSYFGMFSNHIHDFEFFCFLFFFLFAWCLGAEKMWESKEK